MINRVISLPTASYGYSELNCRSRSSRKPGGAERSSERAVQKNDGAERGARGRGAGTERRAGVTEIGWSVERLFRPLRSHAPAATGSDKTKLDIRILQLTRQQDDTIWRWAKTGTFWRPEDNVRDSGTDIFKPRLSRLNREGWSAWVGKDKVCADIVDKTHHHHH